MKIFLSISLMILLHQIKTINLVLELRKTEKGIGFKWAHGEKKSGTEIVHEDKNILQISNFEFYF